MKNKNFTNKLMMPLFVLVNIFSTVALSQTSPEGHYRDENGNIVFDLKTCSEIPCTLSYKSAKIEILHGGIYKPQGTTILVANSANPITVKSSLPISYVKMLTDHTRLQTNTTSNRTSLIKTCEYNGPTSKWVVTKNDNVVINRVEIEVSNSCSGSAQLQFVAVMAGNTDTIVEDMKNASSPLILTYTSIGEHLSDFRQIVSKNSSDARHLNRLESQIKNTLKLMVDEKGNALLPVTHRKITESSRMIMVLATVLEEITDSYDFTSRFLEPLEPAKKSLNKLSQQIRTLYGWDDGLAGSGSKALAALGTILDSELRSLYSLTATFNNDAKTAQAFNAIFRANSVLVAKVNASNAGDIAGTDAAKTVIQNWNSAEFQNILQLAMSAPKDAQSQIQNRILMALTAIESIKDYVDPKDELKSAIDLPTSVRSKLK